MRLLLFLRPNTTVSRASIGGCVSNSLFYCTMAWTRVCDPLISGEVADCDCQYYVRRPARKPVQPSELEQVVTSPPTTVHDEEPNQIRDRIGGSRRGVFARERPPAPRARREPYRLPARAHDARGESRRDDAADDHG